MIFLGLLLAHPHLIVTVLCDVCRVGMVQELKRQDDAEEGFIENWCKQRFAEKEAMLTDFYKFPAASQQAELAKLNPEYANPR